MRIAGVLLVVTGALKLFSGLGTEKVLDQPDPIFGINTGGLLFFAGLVEIGIGGVCVCRSNGRFAAGLLGMLATTLLIYRIGLMAVHFNGYCQCVGSLTAAIHLSPQLADNSMRVLLGVLLVTAYSSMAIHGMEKTKTKPA